jgi:glutamate-ammonia-ligase adenylyltransferase
LSARVRRLLHRFLSSALTSQDRYAVVIQSAAAIEEAFTVFESSDFLSDILIRYPDEIATVCGTARQPRNENELPLDFVTEPAPAPDSSFAFAYLPEFSYSQKLVLLRRHFRHRIFALGTQDLFAPLPVFDSLERATLVADAAINAAFAIAHEQLRASERQATADFAVLGLGRLGAREFDLGSDADLLFVRGEKTDPAAARRLAEHMVEALAAYTQEGTVFAVDTRLRPLGAEGELVTTPAALRAYFDLGGDAQAWEALSFTKLRPLAGSVELARRADVAVRAPAERFAASAGFPAKVTAMRERIAQSENGGAANFKTAKGGFYDIDFITAYLLIRHRLPFEAGNTRKRLHGLAAAGLLSDPDCATLDYAAELLRAAEHAIRLFSGRARAVLPQAEHARHTIEHLAFRMLDEPAAGDLQSELRRVQEAVRGIFNRIIC